VSKRREKRQYIVTHDVTVFFFVFVVGVCVCVRVLRYCVCASVHVCVK